MADLRIGPSSIHGTLPEGAVPVPPTEALPSVLSTQSAPQQFTTYRVDDPNLVTELEASGIAFPGQADTSWFTNLLSWLLPFIVLFLFWGVYLQRLGSASGGLMAVGKSRARIYVEQEIKVRFDDVAGLDEAKEEQKEVIEFLRTSKRFPKTAPRRYPWDGQDTLSHNGGW